MLPPWFYGRKERIKMYQTIIFRAQKNPCSWWVAMGEGVIDAKCPLYPGDLSPPHPSCSNISTLYLHNIAILCSTYAIDLSPEGSSVRTWSKRLSGRGSWPLLLMHSGHLASIFLFARRDPTDFLPCPLSRCEVDVDRNMLGDPLIEHINLLMKSYQINRFLSKN